MQTNRRWLKTMIKATTQDQPDLPWKNRAGRARRLSATKARQTR